MRIHTSVIGAGTTRAPATGPVATLTVRHTPAPDSCAPTSIVSSPRKRKSRRPASYAATSGRIAVTCSSRQSSSSQNGGGQTYNGNPQRLIISEDNAASATTAGRSYGRMLGANGGVDITV